MSRDGARQAAQLLRTHLASVGAPDRRAQISTIATLIYSDRLNQPPIYPDDPNAIDEVITRFSDILGDHLDLAAVMLSATAGMLNTAPAELLDQVVAAWLGGYD